MTDTATLRRIPAPVRPESDTIVDFWRHQHATACRAAVERENRLAALAADRAALERTEQKRQAAVRAAEASRLAEYMAANRLLRDNERRGLYEEAWDSVMAVKDYWR